MLRSLLDGNRGDNVIRLREHIERKGSEVGHTDLAPTFDGVTYTSRAWLHGATIPEITDHLMHEQLHRVGFTYARRYSRERCASIPYAVGELERSEVRLEQKLEQKLDEKLEQKLEEKLEQKLDKKLDEKLGPRLAHLATKAELHACFEALLARIESGEQRLVGRIEQLERRTQEMDERLLARIELTERRLLNELAPHTRALYEDMARHVSVMDDKYKDLPPRVGRLEAKVFPPRRR